MYQNYLSIATAIPDGGKIPVENLIQAVQELDSAAFYCLPNPTIVQETDKDGNPRFQENGTPVYKSLDDQYVPILEMSKDKLDVHTAEKPDPGNVEGAKLMGADVSSAITSVTNRYMSVNSYNQYIDDQNTLAEKHGKLTQIKPLEDNPPRQIIVATDDKPHLIKDLNRLAEGLKKLNIGSPLSGNDDLRVVILVFSDDTEVQAFYTDLQQKENLVDAAVLFDGKAKTDTETLKKLLGEVLV